jgi:hypothetical protein
LCTQRDLPCKKRAKNELCGKCSNNNFDFKIRITSNIRKSRNKDPIMKLGSFGHNSFKYYAYLSSSCPCIIIPMRVAGNCLNLDFILLQICNLGSVRTHPSTALILSSKCGINFYKNFGARYVFLASPHTQ